MRVSNILEKEDELEKYASAASFGLVKTQRPHKKYCKQEIAFTILKPCIDTALSIKLVDVKYNYTTVGVLYVLLEIGKF